MLVRPIISLEAIDRSEANAALIRWEHRMGPCNRPFTCWSHSHGLFHGEELVAVALTEGLMAAAVGGLSRDEAVELSRLCAAGPSWNRVMLRLWREAVFPALRVPWAVSYQDMAAHRGNLYRFDGWVKLGESHSGPDRRTGRKGRSKIIWGWSADAARVAQRRLVA